VLQNLTNGEFREICTEKGDQINPRISGRNIVWTDKRNEPGEGDIYLFDLGTEREIPVCTAPGLQQFPAIAGATIAWMDFRDGIPAIYSYNLSSGTEMQLSDRFSVATQPQVSEDYIVWSESSALDRQDTPARWIVVYDIARGEKEILPLGTKNPWLMDLDKNRILYADPDHLSLEEGYVHLFVIDMPEENRVPVPSPTPQTGNPKIQGSELPLPATTHPSPGSAVPPVIGAAGLVLWIGYNYKR
jgi:beta propeller repeat protein